ncbi:hypothetical protein [uncultured Cardiobacterium sp.]|uniref:hypothetical protein n=1 Tax=uncultured Cardiobacterium sp. TaxID=417619 RepID=UPI002631192D|nr:hypothetical protein [uncultured Cardiobacterium sp.]
MMMSGQNPPMPALMGRNKTPAPTAVPNRLMAQVKLKLLWKVFMEKSFVLQDDDGRQPPMKVSKPLCRRATVKGLGSDSA